MIVKSAFLRNRADRFVVNSLTLNRPEISIGTASNNPLRKQRSNWLSTCRQFLAIDIHRIEILLQVLELSKLIVNGTSPQSLQFGENQPTQSPHLSVS